VVVFWTFCRSLPLQSSVAQGKAKMSGQAVKAEKYKKWKIVGTKLRST
jgi:hypothetical protein